jgi:hypothetical protein
LRIRFVLKVIPILILALWCGGSLYAQKLSKADSLKQARLEKRAIDSLKLVEQKLAFRKQQDSAKQARLQKRITDSLARLEQKQRTKDSLELVKFRKKEGEAAYQLKVAELDRLKKLDQKIKRQREEDSLRVVKENYIQYQKDSALGITKEQLRAKFVRDSIQAVEEQIRLEQARKDSLTLVRKLEKEFDDSVKEARRQERIQLIEEELQRTAEANRIADSLKQIAREENRLAQQRLLEELRIKEEEKKIRAAMLKEQRKKQSLDSALTDPSASTLPKVKNRDTLSRVKKTELVQNSYDYLRKVDSIKFYFNTFRYRLRKSTEWSFYFGPSIYAGDLGGTSGIGRRSFYDNNFRKRNFFYGTSVTYTQNERWGVRLSFIGGKISASDQDVTFQTKTDNAYTRYKRNLDFQTSIAEWSLMAEINPFKFKEVSSVLFKHPVQPYALLGLGRFSFNPQGSYYDDIAEDFVWVDLQPLRTEGQGMKEYPDRKVYKLRQLNIPFGFGVKYVFGRRSSLGFEFVGRKLFTDYLDDVSTRFIDPELFSSYLSPEDAAVAKQVSNKSDQVDPDNVYASNEIRGNPKQPDFYYSFNLKFSFRISKLK